MIFIVPVRVTRTRKCREGFYLIINGKRLRYATRALALEEVRGFIELQKLQVCTVREFAARTASKIKQRMPEVAP